MDIYFDNIINNYMNNLLYIILITHLTCLVFGLDHNRTELSLQRIYKLLSISRQYQHKFEIDINHSFSSSSDITAVITSCNRFDLLKVTLNSFFHYNTYPLNQLIIIQDCSINQPNIWSLLPSQAITYKDKFFRVLVNRQRLGQIASIDKAYQFVKTKYVYHLEDDWAHLGSYGFLQKMKDALMHAQKNNIKVSQAVQTLSDWSWTHMLGPLYHSSHNTKYYIISSYGKQYLYRFSFNPHLMDYQNIYKRQLNSSYIYSIARRYHCLNTQSSFMSNGGCVEDYTGKHLSDLQYKQIYVEIRKKPLYQHMGSKQNKFTIESFNFERTGVDHQRIKQSLKSSKATQNEQNMRHDEIAEPLKQEQEQKQQHQVEDSFQKTEQVGERTGITEHLSGSYYINTKDNEVLLKLITTLGISILIMSIYKVVKLVQNKCRRVHNRKYDVRISYGDTQ